MSKDNAATDKAAKDIIEKCSNEAVNETNAKGEPTKSDKEDNAKGAKLSISPISSPSIQRNNKMPPEKRHRLNELKDHRQQLEEIK